MARNVLCPAEAQLRLQAEELPDQMNQELLARAA